MLQGFPPGFHGHSQRTFARQPEKGRGFAGFQDSPGFHECVQSLAFDQLTGKADDQGRRHTPGPELSGIDPLGQQVHPVGVEPGRAVQDGPPGGAGIHQQTRGQPAEVPAVVGLVLEGKVALACAEDHRDRGQASGYCGCLQILGQVGEDGVGAVPPEVSPQLGHCPRRAVEPDGDGRRRQPRLPGPPEQGRAGLGHDVDFTPPAMKGESRFEEPDLGPAPGTDGIDKGYSVQ